MGSEALWGRVDPKIRRSLVQLNVQKPAGLGNKTIPCPDLSNRLSLDLRVGETLHADGALEIHGSGAGLRTSSTTTSTGLRIGLRQILGARRRALLCIAL